jgi:hypothetical protein
MILKNIRGMMLLFFLISYADMLFAQTTAKHLILIDIAHNQKFWNDPTRMEGHEANFIERIRYMTNEITKTAASVKAEVGYLTSEIQPDHLAKCDLLFIHMPSAKYSPTEIEAIKGYLRKGGSLFLVMEVDYWSTLEQTNVNDIVNPFGIQFENNSPDTLTGGYTKAGLITDKKLKVTYHGARIVKGGTPFCFNNQSAEPFGTFIKIKNGGKIVAMGDGMVSLYMTSWKDVTDYQCSEFMHDVFAWLLK